MPTDEPVNETKRNRVVMSGTSYGRVFRMRMNASFPPAERGLLVLMDALVELERILRSLEDRLSAVEQKLNSSKEGS